MKCLSICQPFADLVASGRKTIELRSWNTGFRGEFLIHAPAKVRMQDAQRLGIARITATGAVIGKAEMYDIRQYENDEELRRDYGRHLYGRAYDRRAKYGFMLRNARRLAAPVPCKGRLGFYEVNAPHQSKDEITAGIIDEEYRYQWIGRH